MKRITSILLIGLLVICSAFGSGFGFKLGEVQFSGILPSLVTAGVSYKGLELSENNTTELVLIGGGGKAERKFYSAPDSQINPALNLPYSTGLAEFTFNQGFKEDLVTLSAGIKAGFEKYNDFTYIDDNPYSLKFAVLSAGLSYNTNDEKAPVRDGLNGFAKLQFAPKLSTWNKNSDGTEYCVELSFAGIEAQAVYAKTLFEKKRDNGLNKFSAVLVDRANVSYVHLFEPENSMSSYLMLNNWKPYSVTEKVRGYNCYTQGIGNFAAVNNFEVRFALPEFKDGLFARVILFADAGVTTGYKLEDKNSLISEPVIISSFGGQLTLNLLDIIDVGVQVAVPYPQEEITPIIDVVVDLKY